MVDLASLIVGTIGAITGVASLIWHISNSRSKVVIDRLHFERIRNHNFKGKEVVQIIMTLRNKSNRSSSIEEMSGEIGRLRIPFANYLHTKYLRPNSSEKFDFRVKIPLKDFEWPQDGKPVWLGATLIHTFGKLHKHRVSDSSSDHQGIA